MTKSDLPADLQALFGQYVHEHPGGYALGREGNIRVNYFLDLMSAALNPTQLSVLSRHFADGLRPLVGGLDQIELIAVPKRGNALLGYEVAKLLKKECIFVKDSVLFDRWIEGPKRARAETILIDDIASDGEMLVDAATALRLEGFHLRGAYAMVHRSESDGVQLLEEADVPYRFHFELGDNDLAVLRENSRAR